MYHKISSRSLVGLACYACHQNASGSFGTVHLRQLGCWLKGAGMFKKTKVSISSMCVGSLVTYVVQRIKYDPRHSLNNPDRFVDLILSFPVDHKDDVSVVSSLLHRYDWIPSLMYNRISDLLEARKAVPECSGMISSRSCTGWDWN